MVGGNKEPFPEKFSWGQKRAFPQPFFVGGGRGCRKERTSVSGEQFALKEAIIVHIPVYVDIVAFGHRQLQLGALVRRVL